jgi:predicted transcriptional regulator
MKVMSYQFKQLLEKMAGGKAPGPSPTFSVFHMLRALELIADRPIGRNKLAEGLNVGEGAVRTIIARLKGEGLIKTSKSGCVLTDKGLRLWEEYKLVFKAKLEIGRNELSLADYNFAILVKNHGHKVGQGLKHRDAAVMVGAKGATTIIVKEGRLVIPSVSNDVIRDFPEAAKQMFKLLNPEENDVIIIGSADTLAKAEYGTLAAAWELLNDC